MRETAAPTRYKSSTHRVHSLARCVVLWYPPPPLPLTATAFVAEGRTTTDQAHPAAKQHAKYRRNRGMVKIELKMSQNILNCSSCRRRRPRLPPFEDQLLTPLVHEGGLGHMSIERNLESPSDFIRGARWGGSVEGSAPCRRTPGTSWPLASPPPTEVRAAQPCRPRPLAPRETRRSGGQTVPCRPARSSGVICCGHRIVIEVVTREVGGGRGGVVFRFGRGVVFRFKTRKG